MEDTSLALEESGITGSLISYYHICRRKVWLHAKGLDLENITDQADVVKGRIIHETRFKREQNRELLLNNIKIDFVKVGDEVIVHEIKKSRKFEEAHIWQVKYYLYVLKRMGVNCQTGIIHYPGQMRKVEVEMRDEDFQYFKNILQDMQSLLEQKAPPPMVKQNFCKKCAYWDFCAV